MNKTYYIAVNGLRTGPFTFNELENKKIAKDTLIWTEGFENWVKAVEIPELKRFINVEPPPIPNFGSGTNTGPKEPPFSTPQNTNPTCFGYQLASRKERFLAFLTETLIILIPYIFFVGWNDIFNVKDDSVAGYIKDAFTGAVIASFLGAIFYPFWGGNLGHRIFGLKVISAKTGKDFNKPWNGALREFAKNFLVAFILPGLWLLRDAKNQNSYDQILETYVVRKREI
jgi:uncharacterized RDD family membrane protein YckC